MEALEKARKVLEENARLVKDGTEEEGEQGK